MKEIKFVSESGNVKTYETAKGSAAYSEFKKDFRESTSKVVGQEGEYRITIESGYKSGLKGYKFSNFGLNDDFDSDGKVVVIKESLVKLVEDNKKKVEPPKVVIEKPEPKKVVSESFTLELDK